VPSHNPSFKEDMISLKDKSPFSGYSEAQPEIDQPVYAVARPMFHTSTSGRLVLRNLDDLQQSHQLDASADSFDSFLDEFLATKSVGKRSQSKAKEPQSAEVETQPEAAIQHTMYSAPKFWHGEEQLDMDIVSQPSFITNPSRRGNLGKQRPPATVSHPLQEPFDKYAFTSSSLQAPVMQSAASEQSRIDNGVWPDGSKQKDESSQAFPMPHDDQEENSYSQETSFDIPSNWYSQSDALEHTRPQPYNAYRPTNQSLVDVEDPSTIEAAPQMHSQYPDLSSSSVLSPFYTPSRQLNPEETTEPQSTEATDTLATGSKATSMTYDQAPAPDQPSIIQGRPSQGERQGDPVSSRGEDRQDQGIMNGQRAS